MSGHEILVRVARADIDLFTKIIEAYDHLGVVSTLNPEEGLVRVTVTPDTRPEVLEIIAGLPFEAILTE